MRSKRNPVAKAVRTPQFRVRVVESEKGKGSYKRSPKHKKTEENY